MDASRPAVILTCEHAGNGVPGEWRDLVSIPAEILNSHRGWDAGALDLARRFADRLGAPLDIVTVTRLIVDANRGPNSPTLHSEFTRDVDPARLAQAVARYHAPFRERTRALVSEAMKSGSAVIHLSVHTFTPIWEGKARPTDIGILFDPNRPGEVVPARAWVAALRTRRPDLRVDENEPYKGTDDGHVTALRPVFGDRYAGLELEVNQRFVGTAAWDAVASDAVESFAAVLESSMSAR